MLGYAGSTSGFSPGTLTALPLYLPSLSSSLMFALLLKTYDTEPSLPSNCSFSNNWLRWVSKAFASLTFAL